jgi:hypothetical protein
LPASHTRDTSEGVRAKAHGSIIPDGVTPMAGSRLLATLLAIVITLAPTYSFAQGFEFDEDDTEPITEEDDGGDGMEFGEDDTGGDDGMTFGEDDVVEEDTTFEGTPIVAVVAIPGPEMDPDRQSEVQAEMMDVLADVPGYDYRGPETILPGLEERGTQECLREPICLGAVGTDAGVDRILYARVTPSSQGGLRLSVDFFEVKDKLTLKFTTRDGLGGTGDIVDNIKPAIYEVMEIRIRDGDNFADPDDDSLVQPIIAYGSAALAVGSLIGGIVFGLKAKSGEDDLEALQNEDGTYDITQKEAESRLRDVQSNATTANIFYGLAVGLAAVSGLFFYLDIGSDVGEDAEGNALIEDLHVAPAVTEGGFGFGAGFRF